jgi:hypothetical protein
MRFPVEIGRHRKSSSNILFLISLLFFAASLNNLGNYSGWVCIYVLGTGRASGLYWVHTWELAPAHRHLLFLAVATDYTSACRPCSKWYCYTFVQILSSSFRGTKKFSGPLIFTYLYDLMLNMLPVWLLWEVNGFPRTDGRVFKFRQM